MMIISQCQISFNLLLILTARVSIGLIILETKKKFKIMRKCQVQLYFTFWF